MEGKKPEQKDGPKKLNQRNLYCTYCTASGHEMDTCFQVIGYPDWWGNRTRNNGGRGRTVVVGRGRGRSAAGHGRGGPAPTTPRVNSVQITGAAASSAAQVESDYIRQTGFTKEQFSSFLNFLNSCKETNIDNFNSKEIVDWIIDSGASCHVTGFVNCLNFLRRVVDCFVGLPDGVKVEATQEGRLECGTKLISDRVLFVPKLETSLLSVSQLVDEFKCDILFTKSSCFMQDSTTKMEIGLLGERREGLYYLRPKTEIKANGLSHGSERDLWHRRLGHPSGKVLDFLSVGSKNNMPNDLCEICLKSKQTREVFPISINKASSAFELVHCDLWGPYRVRSTCDASYFLTVVDDYSRAVWIYLLVNKSEVSRLIRDFLAMAKRQFNKDVKRIRSDNGTEFVCLTDFFAQNGIIHETSCVRTPQQNGRVERKHRHILNVARALRFQANLPIKFWGECILAAGHLINRTPSDLLKGKTPYEFLFGKPPIYTHLRVFGCLCYAKELNTNGDKFASRSRKCVFLGYPFGKKGWRLYDLEKKDFLVSRDVVFSETEFPFSNSENVDLTTSLGSPASDADVCPEVVHGDVETTPTSNPVLIDIPLEVTEAAAASEQSHAEPEPLKETEDRSGLLDVVSGTIESGADVSPTADNEELGRGMRIKHSSVRLKDYVVSSVQCPSASLTGPAPSSGIRYPLTHFVNYANFSPKHRAFLAAITAGDEPRSFKAAMADSHWQKAMKEEILALEKNKTWTVEDLPPGKKAIGSKWVFKIKYRSDGTIERYKARLVVLGNHQVAGIDFHETFAPVAKLVTVRLFLSVAIAKGWELHQMDVHNAFLHGDLTEEVFMKMPPGFAASSQGKVCRLRKSLYGLRQAPRCWFAKFAGALRDYGFLQSHADYSLFTWHRSDTWLCVLVYVDDLIIGGNDPDVIHRFKGYLSDCFHMKDLGPLKYFLGIEVARNKEGLFLSQRKYVLDIISEVGLLAAKPSQFPVEQNHKLATTESALLPDPERYRRLVGRLIYLTITRPELSYGVHTLAQFMHSPTELHWDAALRVVRYLKGHPGQGILLRSDCDFQFRAYCDSDWASCPITRRSLSGYFILFGHSPVSWKTKKQQVVSRSSAEAEYRSMAVTVCELKWLKALLHSLGVQPSGPMHLFCDSQAALHIAANPVFHERTKHIEIDCHFVRDEVQRGEIVTHFVRSGDQLADIFTKALGTSQFDFLLRKLGVRDPHAPP